jgi:hyperosmotically inducible periplasmic protein
MRGSSIHVQEGEKLMQKKGRTKVIRGLFTMLAAFVLCIGVAGAQESTSGQNAAPDNTKTNRDRSQGADQQHELASDRVMTQQIRKSIMADKTLSSYAHNVKIITQNGHVTLAGPVRSEEEKNMVAAKAAELAGATNVTNQLQVAPSK